MAKNKLLRNASIAIGIFLFIAILVALAGKLVQQTALTMECVNPDWNTLKCEQVTTKRSVDFSVTGDNQRADIPCGSDQLLATGDTCELNLKSADFGIAGIMHVVYGFCDLDEKGYLINCPSGGYCFSGGILCRDISKASLGGDATSLINKIPTGKGVRIVNCETSELGINKNCVFTRKSQPYVLKTLDPEITMNNNNCIITNDAESGIVTKIGDTTIADKSKSGAGAQLKPEETRPFVSSLNRGFCDNIVTHPKYGKVFCSGNTLYKIQNMEFADGELVALGEQGTKVEPSGQNIRGFGERIATVGCCPQHFPECDPKTFTLRPTPPTGKCKSDLDVPSAGNIIATTSQCGYRYKCVNSEHSKQPEECFECLDNVACANGEVCNTLLHKCEKGGGGQYCGDGVCASNENPRTCPGDCGNPPPPSDLGKIILYSSIALIGGILAGVLIKRATRGSPGRRRPRKTMKVY